MPKSLCLLEGVLLAGMVIYCLTDVRDLVRRKGSEKI
jgi:hypothetical protein